jgi:hypothetical protein
MVEFLFVAINRIYPCSDYVVIMSISYFRKEQLNPHIRDELQDELMIQYKRYTPLMNTIVGD